MCDSSGEKNSMDIFTLFLIVFCFFIMLFVIHSLAIDDFVLLRRHVTMVNLFDHALITFVIGLISARLIYIIFHFSPGFLNPLVFFIFPYFPGLSLGGGVVGSIIFLFFYTSLLKLPKERIFDIFSISFLCTLPIGLFLLAIKAKKTPTIILSEGILIIISIVFLAFLIRLFQKGSIKDGSISLLSLCIFSFISFLAQFFLQKEKVFFFLSIDQLILFCLFIFSLLFFIKQEYLFFRKKLS